MEELFKEHRALFLNVARQILDSFAEAEDAVSEAMIRIITNLDKISALPRHKIRSYCIVIVRNCALARFRKAGEIPTEMSIAVNDSLIQPEEAFLEQEQAKELQDIIRALSREERMLLQLRYVDDANYKEIADILGITEETARKRTERILRKLRELLKKDRHNG
ncbi:MAG: sigma-70 family RNA polymerase sigma factor [Lachnospiraceae bacterium]|nr:sigma-70 family RNA polymerase sigma factor [Lachnospiraceae bacterium]